MTTLPLRSTLLIALLLVACGDKETPKDTGGGGGEPDTGVDTDDPDDTGEVDDTGERPAFSGTAEGLLRVDPWTMPEDEGGTVRFRVAMAGSPDLDADLAGRTVVGVFPDGTEVGMEASVPATTGADSAPTLELGVVVPAGLTSGGGRIPLTVSVDGVFLMEVPVTLHSDATTAVERLEGAAERQSQRPDETICHTALDDDDGDGQIDVLTVGINDDGQIVARACPVGGGACDTETIDPVLEAGDELLCGTTDHFRPARGGHGYRGAYPTRQGNLCMLSGLARSSGSWNTDGTATTVEASIGIFAVVLGLNTSKNEATVPLEGMLTVGQTGGRWRGGYDDGRTPGTWSSLGTTSVTDIVNGTAWAGLFTASDLSKDPDAPTEHWVWVIDSFRMADGGGPIVTVGDFTSASDTGPEFTSEYAVELTHPGFTPETATVVGEDLDGDGAVELVVEAWGDGRHAVWFVHPPTERTEPTVTQGWTDTGALSDRTINSVQFTGIDTFRPSPPTSFTLGDSTLRSTQIEMDGLDSAGGVGSVILTATAWKLDEVMDLSAVQLSPSAAGVLGRATFPKTLPRNYDRCGWSMHCKASWSSYTVQGTGSGSAAADEPLTAGDLVFAGPSPSGDALVLTRGLFPDTPSAQLPVLSEPDGSGGFETLSIALGNDGPWLMRGETAVESVGLGDHFSAIDDGAGGAARFRWIRTAETTRTEDDMPVTTETIDLHLHFDGQDSGALSFPADTTAGGSTVPVVLDMQPTDDGGATLFWRDGAGQAWLGEVDLASAAAMAEGEVPFLDGPEPVGGAGGYLDNLWPTSHATSCAITVPLAPVGGDGFLSGDIDPDRFDDWDTPLAAPYTPPGGATWMLTVGGGADDGCALQTWLVAPGETLVGAIGDATVFSESTDPECQDLQVPVLAGSFLTDAPPLALTQTPSGHFDLVLVDKLEGLAGTRIVQGSGESLGGAVSAADLNGDGLTDLLIQGVGGGTNPLLSDGQGGLLDADVDADLFTNFSALLGGGERGQECSVDTVNGGPVSLVPSNVYLEL
jgi:hypothetical protein